MSRRDNMLRTLNGINTGQIPVTPHWWGLYKFEISGLLKDYSGEAEAWGRSGAELAEIDSYFFEMFRPDMFHLTTGAPKFSDSTEVAAEKKRIFDALYELESYSVIDEYIAAFYQDKKSVLDSGIFDHVKILSDKYGHESTFFLNEGNPISWILDPNGCVGFENGLISMLEKPDKMEYLLHHSYKALLPRMEALKQMGADGYIGSETYCSADIMSPELYRGVIFNAQRDFYNAIGKMGLIPITYFLGNIVPLIDDIKGLGVRGLMIEESKKNFNLDVSFIYDKLERVVCLFGNLDSVYIMQNGSREDVIQETIRQTSACNKGAFIMSNGCPLSFTTPPENVSAMIDTARRVNK